MYKQFCRKNIAKKELKGKSAKSFLDGKVQLVYAENSGGMLSLGSDLDENVKLILFKVVS